MKTQASADDKDKSTELGSALDLGLKARDRRKRGATSSRLGGPTGTSITTTRLGIRGQRASRGAMRTSTGEAHAEEQAYADNRVVKASQN